MIPSPLRISRSPRPPKSPQPLQNPRQVCAPYRSVALRAENTAESPPLPNSSQNDWHPPRSSNFSTNQQPDTTPRQHHHGILDKVLYTAVPRWFWISFTILSVSIGTYTFHLRSPMPRGLLIVLAVSFSLNIVLKMLCKFLLSLRRSYEGETMDEEKDFGPKRPSTSSSRDTSCLHCNIMESLVRRYKKKIAAFKKKTKQRNGRRESDTPSRTTSEIYGSNLTGAVEAHRTDTARRAPPEPACTPTLRVSQPQETSFTACRDDIPRNQTHPV